MYVCMCRVIRYAGCTGICVCFQPKITPRSHRPPPHLVLAARQVVQRPGHLPHDVLLRGLQGKHTGPPQCRQALCTQWVIVGKGVWARGGLTTRHSTRHSTRHTLGNPWTRRLIRRRTVEAAALPPPPAALCAAGTGGARKRTAVHHDVILFVHRGVASLAWHPRPSTLGNRDRVTQRVGGGGGGVQGSRRGCCGQQRERGVLRGRGGCRRVFEHGAGKGGGGGSGHVGRGLAGGWRARGW